MEQNSSLPISETDWERIAAMADAEIDFGDLPELTAEQFKNAELRLAGKPVERSTVQKEIDEIKGSG